MKYDLYVLRHCRDEETLIAMADERASGCFALSDSSRASVVIASGTVP